MPGWVGMYYRTGAIVLKSRDYRDADKLVTVFSEREGKIRAIARGVKKPRSSLRACLQPFCYSSLYFHRGKELDLITQGRLSNFYGNIREDLQCTLYVVYLLELLDKALWDRNPFPNLFRDMISVLENLDQLGYIPLIVRYAEMSILVNLGYRPVLEECVWCGRREEIAGIFDLGAGGLVCHECMERSRSHIALHGEALGLLRLMLTSPIQALQRVKASQSALLQLEAFLEKYLEYHLESKLKMKDTIGTLKSVLADLDKKRS